MSDLPDFAALAADDADPCAVASMLRGARLRLLAGEKEVEFRFDIAGEGRQVRFAEANADRLDGAIRLYEAACLRSKRGRGRAAIRGRFNG